MTSFQLYILPLLIGFVLDLFIGDPYKLPHPIRWFGRETNWLEKQLNKGEYRKIKGIFMVLFLVTQVWIILYAFGKLTQPYPWVYISINSILVFYALANKSLITEVLKVEKALQNGGVEAGRKQVQMIVGRDTSNLNAQQIRTAALETLAENLSDGVITPLFFYALGGVPAMFAFKMVSTLDSIVGYKNDRYTHFGWAGARLDDVANYVPARITAFIMALVSFKRRPFSFILKYGRKHASPNSGMPESALAGILNCRFGGPNLYHGKWVNKPYIGNNNRKLDAADIYKACTINGASSLVFLALVIMYFAFFK